jgi:uncharacterized membrane protein YkoI
MKPKPPSRLLIASALAVGATFVLFGAEVLAGDKHEKRSEHDIVREALKRGEVQPLTTILAIASQTVPGDVIEVELEEDDDVLVYEIKVLTAQGRVREVKIEASTGKVLEVEDD